MPRPMAAVAVVAAVATVTALALSSALLVPFRPAPATTPGGGDPLPPGPEGGGRPADPPGPDTAAAAVPAVPRLETPVLFEPNRGQAAPGVAFVGRAQGALVELLPDGVRVVTPDGQASGLRFAGARAAARLEGLEPKSSYTSYFIGQTAVAAVPHFGAVAYRGLYPGIDVVFYPAAGGAMEFDYHVAAGADPAAIRIEPLPGGPALALDPSGGLQAGAGFFLEPPVSRQDGAAVASRYVADGAAVRLGLGPYDPARPLTIDPRLGFSSYFGGGGADRFTAVKGYAGHAFAAGMSRSSAATQCLPMPACPVSYSMAAAASAVVAKFDLTQDGPASLVWIARIAGVDQFNAMDVDATGIYLTGTATVARSGGAPGSWTGTDVFPLTGNAFQAKHGSAYGSGLWGGSNCASPYDAFLLVLDVAGTSVSYGSYLGGQFADWGYGVAADGAGGAAVVGAAQWTNGGPFPTKNAFQPAHNGPPAAASYCAEGTEMGCLDAFVARFDTTVPATPAGANPESLVFASLAGAGGEASPSVNPPLLHADWGYSATTCALDSHDDYPEGTSNDVATDVDLDASGGIWVVGYTSVTPGSVPQFPAADPATPGYIPPSQAATGGDEDGFVLKVSPTGDLLHSSFLGGGGLDRAYAVAVAGGQLYVAGTTESTNFPMPGPGYRTTAYGGVGALQDAFVARFDASTGAISRATYLGSAGEFIRMVPRGCSWYCNPYYGGSDVATSVQVDPRSGDVHVQGVTDKGTAGTAGRFPTLHAWPGLGGQEQDLFAAAFSPDLETLRFSTPVGSVMDDVARGCVPVTGSGCDGRYQAGFPVHRSYPSPGHAGTLLADAQSRPGASDPVLAGGMGWPNRGDVAMTWNFGDGTGDIVAPYGQQYLVHRWELQSSPCPPPPPQPWSPWYVPCYQWPPDGHLQWDVTHTVTDAMGNVASFTKPLHLVLCSGTFNGGMPIPQAATPFPPATTPWPVPTIRGEPSTGRWWSTWDSRCVTNPNFDSCCDFYQDSYPTAGGFPIGHSAADVAVPMSAVNAFKRTNEGFGDPTWCCSTATPNPPDAVLARLRASEPFVACGVETAPPLHRATPLLLTWAPAGLPHTYGVETYDPGAVPADPDYGMDVGSFRWDFDYDGAAFDPEPSADGQVNPTYTYPAGTAPGLHTVMVQARDTQGTLGAGTCVVDLVNLPPVAACATPETTYVAGDLVPFASAGTADPDGAVASYAWTFPGGSPPSSSSASPVVSWAAAGVYAVTLTVTDNDGAASAPAECAITVLAGNSFVFNEDQAGSFDLLDGLPGFTLLGWSLPGKGALAPSGGGAFTYTPRPDANGPDSFTYRVRSPAGEEAARPVSIAINPVNDAPEFTIPAEAPVSLMSGAFAGPGWAVGVGAGPATAIDEAGQAVAFAVASNSNAPLFRSGPTLERTPAAASVTPADPPTSGAFALLRFEPSGLTGSSTVCFVARDDGGTDTVETLGLAPARTATGVDASDPQCVVVSVFGPPVAYFEASAAVAVPGQAVTFDACPQPVPYCTHDPDGWIVSHLWEFGDGASSRAPAPTHAFRPGTYLVRLTVTDDAGLTDVFDRLVVVAWPDAAPVAAGADGSRTAPLAEAGEDLTAREGEIVRLAGRQVGGAAGTFQWSQVGGPAVDLRDAASANPAFTAPRLADGRPAVLVFALRVADGAAVGPPDYVTVTVRTPNRAPLADAGETATAEPGEAVRLDGSLSTDPDGDPLSYAWRQVGGPGVLLSGAGGPRPSFAAPEGPARLQFEVRASDGQLSGADVVTVYVQPRQAPAPPPPVAADPPPPARARPATLDAGAALAWSAGGLALLAVLLAFAVARRIRRGG